MGANKSDSHSTMSVSIAVFNSHFKKEMEFLLPPSLPLLREGHQCFCGLRFDFSSKAASVTILNPEEEGGKKCGHLTLICLATKGLKGVLTHPSGLSATLALKQQLDCDPFRQLGHSISSIGH